MKVQKEGRRLPAGNVEGLLNPQRLIGNQQGNLAFICLDERLLDLNG